MASIGSTGHIVEVITSKLSLFFFFKFFFVKSTNGEANLEEDLDGDLDDDSYMFDVIAI